MPSLPWLVEVAPEAPLCEAADAALRPRFKAVRKHFRGAVQTSDKNGDHVHQLREAVRRSLAAIHLYKDLLPKQKRRRVKRFLRELRKAAGAARDWDVFANWLAQIGLPSELEFARELGLKHARQARRSVQPGLKRLYEATPAAELKSQMRRLRPKLRRSRALSTADAPATFASDAARRLRENTADFFEAAAEHPRELTDLHYLRIQTKRLRYKLEMLANALPPPKLEALYALLRDLQGRLGAINDRATAAEFLQTWRVGRQPEEQALVRNLEEQNSALLRTDLAAFHAWWTPEQQGKIHSALLELTNPAEPSSNDGREPPRTAGGSSSGCGPRRRKRRCKPRGLR
ncbi:MAG TPA: CHAD domain-containing protein [Pirellulales bacterium]|jgi:CHAD domain-containing protein|nr:CHAD domain-containing protein [Pirellulales bacterium]